MTVFSSFLAETTFGKKCADYLNSIAGVTPLQYLRNKFARALTGESRIPLLYNAFLNPDLDRPTRVLLLFTALACALLAIGAMSGWGGSLSNFWHRSPYNSIVSTSSHVSDSDFSYITNDDVVEPASSSSTASATSTIPRETYGGKDQGDADPDIILLKHRGVTYPLHFPAYAINDGALTVRELRQRAAEETGSTNFGRIRLLYKGKLLKDDSRPCKSEGLKQKSEVLCVVSEVQQGESSPSDESVHSEAEEMINDSVRVPRWGANDDTEPNRKKKLKGRRRNKDCSKGPVDHGSLTPPMEKRPSSSGRSSAPSPAPSLNSFPSPREKVIALTAYFRDELLPLCEEYIANPPADAKVRDFEHKKLTETIFAQIMLKADGIQPDGDEDARNARRALIKDVQATLAKLDSVANEL